MQDSNRVRHYSLNFYMEVKLSFPRYDFGASSQSDKEGEAGTWTTDMGRWLHAHCITVQVPGRSWTQ